VKSVVLSSSNDESTSPRRGPPHANGELLNAFTVDVEDYFQASASIPAFSPSITTSTAFPAPGP